MIKKIAVSMLRSGMFVHDFNCQWLENPFFASKILIKDEAMIAKVKKAGIREIYIDTTKGADVEGGVSEEQVRNEIDTQISQIARENVLAPVPIVRELQQAKVVRAEAKKIITNIMHDVRMGKQVEVEAVEGVVEKMVDSIFRNQGALTTLSQLKSKDEYTFFHSVNVCVLMVSFAKGAGFPREVITRAGVGALLHDIGKMAVPQDILNKADKLTDEEFQQMKNHVVQSREILARTPGISPEAAQVAGEHHERFDGTGYPDGKKGTEISEMGRMAAIVDVYDAITSDRIYHKGMSSPEALRKIFEWSKYHFDPDLVQRFIKVVGIYPVGTVVRMQSGMIGVVKLPGEKNLLMPVVKVFYDGQKGRYVDPKDVDLSLPTNGADRIVGNEKAEQYKVNPLEFVGLI